MELAIIIIEAILGLCLFQYSIFLSETKSARHYKYWPYMFIFALVLLMHFGYTVISQKKPQTKKQQLQQEIEKYKEQEEIQKLQDSLYVIKKRVSNSKK